MTRRENPVPTIKFIVSKILKCDKKEVLLRKELIKDLGADSMQVLQIIIVIEREFRVEFDDERLGDSLNGGGITVRKLIDEVKRRVHASDAFKRTVSHAARAPIIDENRAIID
ncbi:acyl carrier protein [Nitrosomonas sp.]|uniref:acyl carrier protein n=1 Tax=Nitrosomonas sp. TaxID=42353 RepID=UPI0025EF6F81|nr:acyl carrier protein [Nitrosomonas sp.]